MPVTFKMVPKKNNLASPPVTKYYPCAVHNGEDDLDRLADIVVSQSTISRADCYGVIIALTKAIGESLSAGRIVRIDNLGTFQITLLVLKLMIALLCSLKQFQKIGSNH